MSSTLLVYREHPMVTLASTNFVNVPVILRYENTNLIEIIKKTNVNFQSQFSIFHPDGTYMAKVAGNRIWPTDEGRKAGITVEKMADVWVCKMDNKPLYEIHHQNGEAFKLTAELYTPDGCFVKCDQQAKPLLFDSSGNALKFGGVTMSGGSISNFKIGIWVKKDGSMQIGVN